MEIQIQTGDSDSKWRFRFEMEIPIKKRDSDSKQRYRFKTKQNMLFIQKHFIGGIVFKRLLFFYYFHYLLEQNIEILINKLLNTLEKSKIFMYTLQKNKSMTIF